jgi:hypothetical protein
MVNNPWRGLEAFGQSIWLDYSRRRLIISGELPRLIAEDGLKGVTSKPAKLKGLGVGAWGSFL